jgi:predicted transcriptional regulator
MDIFSKDVNLHRIPIIDDNGDVIGIVSQNQMIKFLAERLKEFPTLATRKLSNYISQDASSVIAIDTSDQVMTAYKTMLEKV